VDGRKGCRGAGRAGQVKVLVVLVIWACARKERGPGFKCERGLI
jgi:hypothetical protein